MPITVLSKNSAAAAAVARLGTTAQRKSSTTPAAPDATHQVPAAMESGGDDVVQVNLSARVQDKVSAAEEQVQLITQEQTAAVADVAAQNAGYADLAALAAAQEAERKARADADAKALADREAAADEAICTENVVATIEWARKRFDAEREAATRIAALKDRIDVVKASDTNFAYALHLDLEKLVEASQPVFVQANEARGQLAALEAGTFTGEANLQSCWTAWRKTHGYPFAGGLDNTSGGGGTTAPAPKSSFGIGALLWLLLTGGF